MQYTNPIFELSREWRDRASTLRRYGGETSAIALEACADELDKHMEAARVESLTLAEAAELSGYSSDHLGRLVRTGKIPNAGRPGSPRILRGDLPKKAKYVAPKPRIVDLDRMQIVRSAINSGD